jgi:CheY-like chemotaxis protein
MQEQKMVLIVEDDPASSDIVAYLLRHVGMKTVVAQTGEDALKILHQQRVDLVFVDLALPGIDGWQLLQSVRADSAGQNLPLVAITAYYDANVGQKARQAGFAACLPKPATHDMIRDLLPLIES